MGVDSDHIKLWLSAMELDPSEADPLFRLLDQDRDGFLSLHELVSGVSKLKGTAKNLDIITLKEELQSLHQSVRVLQGAYNHLLIGTGPQLSLNPEADRP